MGNREPDVYKTEVKSANMYPGQLLPDSYTKFLTHTGRNPKTGAETGSIATVVGPVATKYDEAESSDPGALFSLTRPTIDHLYASQGDSYTVPATLGLAHEHAVKKHGMVPQHAGDLSVWSQKVVGRALKNDVIKENPRSARHYDWDKKVEPGKYDMEWKNDANSLVSSRISEVKNLPSRFVEELPEGTFKRASAYGRNLLRDHKTFHRHETKQADHPQFEQLELF